MIECTWQFSIESCAFIILKRVLDITNWLFRIIVWLRIRIKSDNCIDTLIDPISRTFIRVCVCIIEFVVNQSWSKFVLFKNKLKFTKSKIREWHSRAMKVHDVHKLHLESWLHDIDWSIDGCAFSNDLRNERKPILRKSANLEKQVVVDVAKKAKVKWSV